MAIMWLLSWWECRAEQRSCFELSLPLSSPVVVGSQLCGDAAPPDQPMSA